MPIDRIRHSLKRSQRGNRDASIFLVGTEGEHTERIYLDIFDSPKIKVVAIPCDDGHSSPIGVLTKVLEARKKFDFGKGDSFWLLVDKDCWTEKMLSEVHSQCKKIGAKILVSNERFEVFLCSHFEDFFVSGEYKSKSYELFLKKKLGGYSKSKFDAKKLLGGVKLACEINRTRDDGKNEIYTNDCGSRAYVLVERIIDKVLS